LLQATNVKWFEWCRLIGPLSRTLTALHLNEQMSSNKHSHDVKKYHIALRRNHLYDIHRTMKYTAKYTA